MDLKWVCLLINILLTYTAMVKCINYNLLLFVHLKKNLGQLHALPLHMKACYERRGALGTSDSFVNQLSWHADLYIQNSLSCSQSKGSEQQTELIC